MTPEERDRIRRLHPRWAEFEAYYAERHRTRWRRRLPWLLGLAAVVAVVLAVI